MKKSLQKMNARVIFASIIFIIFLAGGAQASYMKDVPMQVTQPDGSILTCLATGNEFHNWMHDANNYTIIKNPSTGYYVYAALINGKIAPTGYIAGKTDPATVGLTPGVNLSEADVEKKTQELKAEKAVPQSNLRTTGAESVRPATGVYNNLVVFISFSDQGEITLPMSTITSKFNALGTPSVRDFYKEVSNSQLDLVSSFYPVSNGTYPVSYRDSHPRSYYTKDAPDGYANGNPDATTREHTLLANAVRAVQNQVPANLLIDGDNDGNIDNIVFVINGYNEAWSDLLWPHRWSLFSQTVKINNKRAYDYNIVFSQALGIGVICHELFHSFGAPDLYHYTDYPHEPSGDWDLMSGGDWNSPRHMTVYLKQRYAKWASSIPVLTTAGRYSLAPVSRSSFAAYRINLPNTDQYLVLEYRKKEGRYETALSGDEGLLIYRINPTINGNGNNGPEELYVFRPGGTNAVNGNLNQATFSQNKNRTRFDDASNPACFLANGAAGGLPANLGITNVSVIGDVISFDFKGGSTTNKIPTIALTAPANNATYTAPATIIISANASDTDGTVSKVEFYNGTTLLGTDVTAPYTFTWTSVAAGTYSITAKATDNSNGSAVSSIATVTVSNPICTLANIKLNTTNYIGTSGSWTGTAIDTKDRSYDGDVNTSFDALQNDGGWAGLDLVSNKKITGIRFYPRANFEGRMIGGKFQASSTADFTSGVVDLYTVTATPPLMWNCITISNNGAYRYVRYLGPSGSHGNVSEVEFYGTSAENVLPAITLTAPANNATFTAAASITISANASDSDGTVSKVDFYNGTTLVGTDVTAPYSFVWTGVGAGTYSITAKATDNSGGATTTSAVTVTVVNPVCTLTNAKLNTTNFIGTNGSWTGTAIDTKDRSYDGNINTSFDALENDGGWAGLDLSANKTITGIRFYSRANFEGRMVGGKFQASSTADFTSGVVDLYTVTATPALMWNCITISNNGAYRYVRYLGPAGSHGNVSEVEFYGTSVANVLPVVTLTSPANNSSATAPATISIAANASDADGTISKVDFYNGSALLGTDVTAPYTFSWSSVSAGTYSITARATDNSGAAVTSTVITVKVNEVVSLDDIIGNACGQNGGNATYSLNATNRSGATSYNWWYTGSAQSVTVISGQPYNAVVAYGNTFSSGQLCVGVNYNVAPWYKQYCKNLSACPANINAFRADEIEETTVVAPNPSADNFKLALKKQAASITVIDSKGIVVKQLVNTSGIVEFGNEWNTGIYTVSIVYADNTTEHVRIVKI